MTSIKRNRILYSILFVLVIALGLSSRTKYTPDFIYPYLGDYLYAVMIFVLLALLFNTTSTIKIAVYSVLICYGIETLQLYQADWINTIRSNKLGALTLGSGFLWSDIVAYTMAGVTCYFIENKPYK